MSSANLSLPYNYYWALKTCNQNNLKRVEARRSKLGQLKVDDELIELSFRLTTFLKLEITVRILAFSASSFRVTEEKL